jgi:hypothetical protein
MCPHKIGDRTTADTQWDCQKDSAGRELSDGPAYGAPGVRVRDSNPDPPARITLIYQSLKRIGVTGSRWYISPRCLTLPSPERPSVARLSYPARRGDGRYFLQKRLGKRAAKHFGICLLRASLGTSDFSEARSRLLDNLVWVQELIEAPDLESFGAVLDARLRPYIGRGISFRRAHAPSLG